MILKSVIKCPHCGYESEEQMPTDRCVFFYPCKNCKVTFKNAFGIIPAANKGLKNFYFKNPPTDYLDACDGHPMDTKFFYNGNFIFVRRKLFV